MWSNDSLNLILRQISADVLAFNRPFESLQNTVTAKFAENLLAEKRVDPLQVRVACLASNPFLVAPDGSTQLPSLKERNALIREFNLRYGSTRKSTLTFSPEVLPSLSKNVIGTYRKELIKSRFRYCAEYQVATIRLCFTLFGDCASAGVIGNEIELLEVESGRSVGCLLVPAFLGDWGPFESESVESYLRQLSRAAEMQSLVARAFDQNSNLIPRNAENSL